MQSYWKRLSMCYMDLTRHTMDTYVLTDVCNVCPNRHVYSLHRAELIL
jgi:hypothetical protein